MAKKLKAFPVGARSVRYPWDGWADGSVWRLTQGEDFATTIANVRASVYMEAKRRGMKARVHQDNDSLIIQFIPQPEK